MLIRFFGSSFLIQYIALVLINGLLWLPAFLHPVPMPAENSSLTPFYHLVLRLMENVPYLIAPLAFILVLMQSFILNSILAFHDIIPKNSLAGAFTYTVLLSSVPGGLVLYPALFALFLLIFTIHWLFRMSDEEENLIAALSIPLLISVASFFYFPAIFLMAFLWMSYMVFRIFKWREWIISLIGLALPFIYLFTVYLWTDKSEVYLEALISFFRGFSPSQIQAGPVQLAILAVITFLMLIPAMVRILPSLGSYNINIRKKFAAIAWLVPLTAAMTLAGGTFALNTLYILPATFFISGYFSLKKKSWFNETVMLLLLSLIALQHILTR